MPRRNCATKLDEAARVIADSDMPDNPQAQARWLLRANLINAAAAVARIAYEDWIHEAFFRMTGRRASRKMPPGQIEVALLREGIINRKAQTKKLRRNLCNLVHGGDFDSSEAIEIVVRMLEFTSEPVPEFCKRCGSVMRCVNRPLESDAIWQCGGCLDAEPAADVEHERSRDTAHAARTESTDNPSTPSNRNAVPESAKRDDAHPTSPALLTKITEVPAPRNPGLIRFVLRHLGRLGDKKRR